MFIINLILVNDGLVHDGVGCWGDAEGRPKHGHNKQDIWFLAGKHLDKEKESQISQSDNLKQSIEGSSG